MRRRTVLLLLLAAAAALPLHADTVRLKNGRAYEGVIAERTPQGVRVQLAFGHIVIPDDQVAAIEAAPSALAGYLKQKSMLQASPVAKASDWLELARWARAHDLETSARESALLAADIDPRLPGLDTMLRPLGLVYEEALARWIPFGESMARKGLVPWNGEWITRDEQRARSEEQARREAVRAQEAASRRLAEAAEAMQRTEERLARREEERELEAERYAALAPVMTFPGFWMPPVVVVVPEGPHSHSPRQPAPPQPPMSNRNDSYGRLQSRQPGSFLPPYGEPIVAPEQQHLPAPGTATASSGG
ncbi:MAG TPA: hypothetical protein VGS57_05745 [Thermoanaerobaculia bacterium]|jgi:hypothetical protein|nr:hypothetical protein [Thermoanaerobaculia bacterium]